MTENNNILNELADLNSSLASKSRNNVYSVPAGYFDTLAPNVMARIKAMDAIDGREELKILSPLLDALSRQMPFEVPGGYFEQLDPLQLIQQDAVSEIEMISPLLSGLRKQNPYAVPAGYFETTLPVSIEEKPVTKVVSIVHRRWFRMAAAAVVTGILVISGFFVFNKKAVDKAPLAKFTRDVKKMDDAQKDDLIDFIDAGLTGKEQVKAPVEGKSKEIRELLKDVSDDELKDIQQQSEDIGDVIMTN